MLKELLEHRLRQVAFVAKQLAKKPLDEFGQQLHIGTMGRRQTATEQLSTVIDHQMQLEAVAPTARAAPARCQSCKHLVLADAPIIADGDEGRVDEADA